jgi:hypothetical protein
MSGEKQEKRFRRGAGLTEIRREKRKERNTEAQRTQRRKGKTERDFEGGEGMVRRRKLSASCRDR